VSQERSGGYCTGRLCNGEPGMVDKLFLLCHHVFLMMTI
jgi:hypothetical protein